jgi:hypothetical protein
MAMEFGYIITKENNNYVYIRGDKKIEVPQGLIIEELPILSINENVTEYFGIVLDPPIYVNEDEKIKVYVKLPLDIGIYVTNRSKYKLIDRIEIYPKKYALYGNIGNGVIYRYWKTSASFEKINTNKHEALTAIEIINEAESIGAISRIIFDFNNFSLFTKDDIVCGELIQLHRLKKGLAVVKLTNKPSLEGGKLIPTIPLKILGSEFEMRFGT